MWYNKSMKNMVNELGETVNTLGTLNTELDELYKTIGEMEDSSEKLTLLQSYKKVYNSMSSHINSTVNLIKFVKDESAKNAKNQLKTKKVVREELSAA